jgi:RsmE family RNA methyltransferase
VNLILFEPHELDTPLPPGDRRAIHLLKVLRRQVGDAFDAGLVNGPRGRCTLARVDAVGLSLTFRWGSPPAPLDPITLIVGLPRPQTARDLLREMTSLGVAHLHFVATTKGEPNYAASTLWSSGEWRRHLIAGAEQAFATQLPGVSWGRTLPDVLASLPAGGTRVALDNYEPAGALGQVSLPGDPAVVLAIGPERGWSGDDRTALRTHRFSLVHLGPRILRVETAAIAAVSILRARGGVM